MSAPVTISEWQAAVHQTAVDKGWHERSLMSGEGSLDVDLIASKLALMHSELSEALEELRRPAANEAGDGLALYLLHGKPEGFVVELADLVIRTLDLCGALGLDLAAAMETKHEYNQSRPYRHGGKRL